MRTEAEVAEFGRNLPDRSRESRLSHAAYEACVPRDFWFTRDEDIVHNRGIFDGVVQRYCARLDEQRDEGFGILFLGDCGTGKSIFLSWILMRAIERGWTTYYTVMPRLDDHMRRASRNREWQERLDLMLDSDLLAIDELAKEQVFSGDSFARMRLERLLKDRFDDSRPTLLATNANTDELGEVYGASVLSILEGKFKQVTMEQGDFRERMAKKMDRLYADD